MNDEPRVWIRERLRPGPHAKMVKRLVALTGLSHEAVCEGINGLLGARMRRVYDLRWVCPEAHRVKSRKAGTDRTRALHEAALLENELHQGTYRDIRRMSWADFRTEHESIIDGALAAGSVTDQKHTLKVFTEACSPKLVSQIRYATLERFRNHLLSQEHSAATVNKYLRTLASILASAVVRNYLAVNPFVGNRRKLFLREPEPKPRTVTVAEFSKLLAVCPDQRWRAFLTVAYHCGLRRGELVNVEWSDIDFDRGILSVENKPDHRTKTGRRREIPMNADVVAALTELRDIGYISRWAFTSRKLNGRRMHHNVGTRLRELVVKAGLVDRTGKARLSLHDLRRSFVTRLLEAGVNPKTVQTLAGHRSLNTTMRHYAGTEAQSAAAAVSKLSLRASFAQSSPNQAG